MLARVALGVILLDGQRRTRRAITREAHIMSTKLDQLRADVAANRSVTESAIALLQGLKQKLDEAIVSDDSDAALQELSDSLESETAKLAQAVSANTPTVASVGEATAQTASPAPEDLPDGHPFKPAPEEPTAS